MSGWRRALGSQTQRTRAASADAHEDTASLMSGGAFTHASDGDYEATVLEDRIRVSLRPIDGQPV